MAARRAAQKAKSDNVFGQRRKQPKMFRAGLYARVSTNDQQTLPMQNRAMCEYATRRGWTVALQVREVNSGAESGKRGRGCWKPPVDGRSTSCWSGDWTAGAAR
jgi:predicted site-specific integrase-resolvase